ncbi:MAG: GatB/YqeY domain-containing protein [Candidatus Neomarinimicrobiota bacterium]|tara:strand:- start:2780 stop:3217 length:438 start_codon:yes stop_codon:yes gene_type:complete
MLKKLEHDMMQALKNKEKEKAGTLRLILSKCKNKAIELRKELSDQEIIKVLQTVAKQHKESIKLYKEGKRDDLVEAEMRELGFVEVYLPSMMSNEDLRTLISSVVVEVGASSMADFGKVMPNVMKQGAGKIDGNTAQAIVKELLS